MDDYMRFHVKAGNSGPGTKTLREWMVWHEQENNRLIAEIEQAMADLIWQHQVAQCEKFLRDRDGLKGH